MFTNLKLGVRLGLGFAAVLAMLIIIAVLSITPDWQMSLVREVAET